MITTVKLKITGMKCGGCENAIKQALIAKDGVIYVDAKHSEDWVKVEFDATVIEEDDIIKIIEDAGFTVVD